MAKFNQKRTTNVVTNRQGGSGVQFAPEMELVSLLATGLDGRFYEKENDREKRLVSLIKEVGQKDPELVAKALVYARSVMGQRSVTHVGAVAVAPILSGSELATKFYTKRDRKANKGGIVYRLDDMLEIMAYYFLRNPNKPLPNALRRGFKKALEAADTYELAKYQGKNKAVSLVDIVKLTRPKPSEDMEEVFKLLLDGKLKQFNTSEDKNTKAGQAVAEKVKAGTITKEEAKTELKEAKADNWKQLIQEGTLGYLALLRNLRNIVTVADNETFEAGLAMLTDPKRVSKSLVFPHQIDLAFEVLLQETSIPHGRKTKLLTAVNEAYELSIPNLKELFTHGRTAVIFDTSASMQDGWSGTKMGKTSINAKPVEKAALIAATFVKGIGGDMYHFASTCEKLNYNPLDSINTIKKVGTNAIGKVGHGTSFDTIFRTLEGKYDRIFVISDMQGGDSIVRGSSYQSYVNKHGQPYVYAIDLCGYGTTMFKQNQKLINLFGYSKDIYEMVKTAEIDPRQILKEIRAIEI
jgi:60 kDa SS-A/Ro ribonucleoprotein